MSSEVSHVLLLGRGRLVQYLSSILICQGFSVVCLSREKISCYKFTDFFDYIFDCLDPSFLHSSHVLETINYLFDIRNRVISSSSFGRYIYISSVNSYCPSIELISETSRTFDLTDSPSPYAFLKLYFESYLYSAVPGLKILRLPSLWEYKLSYRSGFFADVVSARLAGTELGLSNDDTFVVTYMHYIDAANQISRVYRNSSSTIVNITSNTWSSRASIKLAVPYVEDNPRAYGLRIVSMIATPTRQNFYL